MNNLWVFHDRNYQKLPISEAPFRPLTIGPNIEEKITVRKFPFTNGPLTIDKDGHEFIVIQNEKQIGKVTTETPFELNDNEKTLVIYLTSASEDIKTYYLGYDQEITFSDDDKDAMFYKGHKSFLQNGESSFTLTNTNGCWTASLGKGVLYLNGQRISSSVKLEVGDLLFWPFMTIRLLEDDLIQITSLEDYNTTLPLTEQPKSEMSKKYPIYRRTPRMVYDLPDEKVSLSFPSQEAEDPNRGLWLIILPPLMMLIVMGIVALVHPRGIFIIISIVMFITTLFTSTVQFFKDKANQKRRQEKRRRVYTIYLENKRRELQELAEKQRHVLYFHFPSFERMKYLTEQISDRLWERTLDSSDFLQFRLGTGTVPSSYQISLNSGDMANREIDDLLEQSQLMERVYRQIDDVPIIANLSQGPMGLIGKESIVKKEIHQIIGQLAFFHSYHDLRFVFILNEEDYEQWEWVKWLPHFQLPHAYAKGLIYNEQSRDQLLSSIYEILRERDLDENKGKIRYTPHIVFIVTNHELISDHVILEYLEGEHAALGISVIFAADAKESLTENIYTLVRYINDEEGDILIQEKKAVQIPFKLDQHQHKGNEQFARMLRTLDHQIGMTNSIPKSVSFLEMFSAKEVDELPIKENWLTQESSKSLAVPVGLKGKEDVVELNLHEKAHGPHGLLAGTTGSGKSEFLQTYILSLAVHFHPHEVAFLLIDYKGGGMAQPFKNMPHLLGTITNIEGSKNFSMRALASIKSELKRRQRLFDQYQVNHINDYTDLYKRNKADKPLPHLFLISDEFAELKSEEPEFIRELVSAARIGRSLGVHLILATQKPGGIIDEQIWSNARFRVALKVQDANDSKEILKNADAASITVIGRGYLQVGNNEVYELFQSAWSGAPYLEETSEAEDEVALVTDLGLIPLSAVSSHKQSKKKDVETEIEVVVNKIEALQKEMGIEKLNSPWLPPLASQLSRKNYSSPNDDEIYFAMIDEPEKQSQSPFGYTVIEDGNIGIFGSSGYGKSQSVITLLLGIASRLSPEEAHYYLFDFGNGTLLPLRQLPHTADYFMVDQVRKIEKFMRILRDEIAKRKQQFQQLEVSSIKMFNALSEEKLPLLFITIDNFDIVKEEMQDLETQINQFARDGQSLGIYMIFTATRVNSIRQSLMNNLRTKVVHYLMDSTEAFSVIGRVPFAHEPIPGRAIIKKDEAYFSQVFLPADGKDDYELMDNIKQEIQLLKEKYKGLKTPVPVPMLPSELTMKNFAQYVEEVEKPGHIPIGLDEEFVMPVYINFVKNNHCLVVGQAQKGKTNVIKVILNKAIQQGTETIGLFDSFDRGLSSYVGEKNVSYIETKEQITEWLDNVEKLLLQREEKYLQGIQQGNVSASFDPVYLVIDGYSRFAQTLDNLLQERMAKLIKNYSHLGFNVIVSGNNNELSKGFDSFTTEIKQIRQALVLMKKSEQTLFTLSYNRKEEEIHPGFGYYVINGKEIKIQIPLCVTERKIYT
ncbi:type VII secretion protein EssC [Bacillus aquiflavi]|uniref:Type VII secretion protein EssC n=1 Tax=Bacillus aquiflavi TaxID=2672567 RepID=A0A6B3VWR0_9BACI|nr:type VII secretion protein EssC [Bacillus aquiflavi]MBA4536974.1 type VII secretion protein EssC [Bacillus aquiflavi]NEY82670.1 type VII secretion protein EssC [Bacillus aquiflavi]